MCPHLEILLPLPILTGIYRVTFVPHKSYVGLISRHQFYFQEVFRCTISVERFQSANVIAALRFDRPPQHPCSNEETLQH